MRFRWNEYNLFIDHFHHWIFSASTSYKTYSMQNCDRSWAFPEIPGYVKNRCVFVIYSITTFPSEGHFNQYIVKSTDFLFTCQKGKLVWFILQSTWMIFCLLKHRMHLQGYYNSSLKVLKHNNNNFDRGMSSRSVSVWKICIVHKEKKNQKTVPISIKKVVRL